MFEVAEAYERQRGRSSKLLAPLFADFAGIRGEVLDVGCGTGALTFAIARNVSVSKIVGLDVSEAFLAYATLGFALSRATRTSYLLPMPLSIAV
jgi:ubiquinone/menaquinone biosynthesis C-methylase UbiE